MDYAGRARESFKSGLVMILPLLISLVIIKFLADYVFLFVNPIVRGTNLASYTGNITVIAQGIAVLLVVVFITLIGYVSNYKASERLSLTINKMIKEIPVFGAVYSTVDRISDSFSGEDDTFQKVVLVDFPDSDLRSLGLLTAEAPEAVDEAEDEKMHSVFIPLTPNPTMGHLVMLRQDQFKELDMSVQEGMKLLLTTGIATKDEGLDRDMTEQLRDLKNELSD
ncbi:MAG: DUF502 domain-containing protein [Candidatus Nanohalobium sp.]